MHTIRCGDKLRYDRPVRCDGPEQRDGTRLSGITGFWLLPS